MPAGALNEFEDINEQDAAHCRRDLRGRDHDRLERAGHRRGERPVLRAEEEADIIALLKTLTDGYTARP